MVWRPKVSEEWYLFISKWGKEFGERNYIPQDFDVCRACGFATLALEICVPMDEGRMR
jgi:hypothetical protein